MLMLNIMLHKISGLDTVINHDVKREHSKGRSLLVYFLVKPGSILDDAAFMELLQLPQKYKPNIQENGTGIKIMLFEHCACYLSQMYFAA